MKQWVTVWGAAPTSLLPGAKLLSVAARTVRVVCPVRVGGERLRLRFSNDAGRAACVLGRVHVGLAGEDGDVMPQTDQAVLFEAGAEGVTIEKGASCVSEPIPFACKPGDRLAVSLFFPQPKTPLSGSTLFPLARRSIPGDFTSASVFPVEESRIDQYCPLLTAVEVETLEPAATVIAFGDSITQQGKWVNPLAERLAQAYPGRLALINRGIGGNRLLRDSVPLLLGMYGIAGVRRIERDTLGCAGARAVILAIGINDLFQPGNFVGVSASQLPTFEEMLEGYNACNLAIRSEGMKLIGATITPFLPAKRYSAEREALRCRINEWIRESGEFDAVLDFDRAVANPRDPRRLLPAYDSGDGLHPNDAGGRAMADCVPLAVFADCCGPMV